MLAEKFWMAKPSRHGRGRDRVVVDGNVVSYLLWGNEIARWDMDEGTLIICDCGWRTNLTQGRLNSILWRGGLGFGIFRERGKWFISDHAREKTYVWEGCHTIGLSDRSITPCRLRTRRPEVSAALAKFYGRARRLLEAKRRILTVLTLSGIRYVISEPPKKRTTVVVVSLDGCLRAWVGKLRAPKVYSIFARNQAKIFREMASFEEINVERDVDGFLKLLREMNVGVSDLPDHLASSLAIHKMLS